MYIKPISMLFHWRRLSPQDKFLFPRHEVYPRGKERHQVSGKWLCSKRNGGRKKNQKKKSGGKKRKSGKTI